MARLDHNTKKLLIVIVNYCCSAMVEKLVEQLNQQSLPKTISMSVLCVDNSESDEETRALKQIQKRTSMRLSLVINSSNCGYGGAINRAAKEQEFDFLCCINPDVDLEETAFDELLRHALQHVAQGIWGVVTINDQRQPDFRHAWPEPNLMNTFAWSLGLTRISQHASLQDNYKYRYLGSSLDSPYSADSVSGCCMLVSSNAWAALGGFDIDFFLYSEEIDLCRRARKLGFQPTVVPTSQLKHRKHTFKETTNRLRIVYRAKLLYMRKHHGYGYNLAYRSCIFTGAANRILSALMSRQPARARQWIRVLWDCIIFEPSLSQTTVPPTNDPT